MPLMGVKIIPFRGLTNTQKYGIIEVDTFIKTPLLGTKLFCDILSTNRQSPEKKFQDFI